MFRKLALTAFLLLGLPIIQASALEITSQPAKNSYTSILIKQYLPDVIEAAYKDVPSQEVKIVLRTKPHDTDRHFDHLKFHELFLAVLTSEKYGWQPLYLPVSEEAAINSEGLQTVVLQGGHIAYQPIQPIQNLNVEWLSPVIDYELGLEIDLDVSFPDRKELAIATQLSVLGENPLWNTMRYRGGNVPKYFEKVIDKFERKLKENYDLIDTNHYD